MRFYSSKYGADVLFRGSPTDSTKANFLFGGRDRNSSPVTRDRYNRSLTNLFQEAREKTDGNEVYYSRERIENVVIMVIVIMILILLIVPIYLLYRFTLSVETSRSNAICIGILLVSTLLFSTCLSMFTSELSVEPQPQRPKKANKTKFRGEKARDFSSSGSVSFARSPS